MTLHFFLLQNKTVNRKSLIDIISVHLPILSVACFLSAVILIGFNPSKNKGHCISFNFIHFLDIAQLYILLCQTDKGSQRSHR